MTMRAVSRRSFLQWTGGLGVLFFADQVAGQAEKKPPKPKTSDQALADSTEGLTPNVFVHVAADGTVSLWCHRSEMGQGVRSTLPPLLADEIGADMDKVKIVQADGDKKYGDQNTDGSSSVRNGYEEYRKAGATARVMLIAAAAKKWGVSPDSCKAEGHAVHHGKKSIPFGDLADAAGKLPVPKPADVKLRPKAEMKHVFRDLPLLDGPAIVTGSGRFGADVRVPGMLFAVIARPPVVGGKVVRYDAKDALAIKGVLKVVQMPEPTPPYAFQPWGGIAVLAENTWAAMRGRKALKIEWDHGKNAVYDSEQYKQALSATVHEPGKQARNVGDVDAALAKAARQVEAEYHVPHLAHVPMEPPCAMASVADGKCEVWTSTQNPQAARTTAAKTLGLDESAVQVHVTLLGGGFGRKSKADFVAEAVLLSKEAGKPVRVQWSRSDDLQHDYYNAVNTQLMTAGLDETGKVTAWRQRTAFTPIASTFAPVDQPMVGDLQQGVTDRPFAIPNVRAETGKAPVHVRVGWLRSVYNIFHAFATNGFIDEIANARGEDPKKVQLELLGDDRLVTLAELGVKEMKNYSAPLEKHPIDTARWRKVIEKVTEMSKWDGRKQAGRSLGLAAHRSFLTYVAVVVSVVKDSSGKIKVDEAWLAADAGTVVNVERARSQMEGAVLFGMSHAFHGGATMKGGITEQANFRDYRLMRMPDAPKAIHVHILDSDGPPCGIGEPGVPPVAPAIANAIFALTGKRYRSFPLIPKGVV